MNIKNLTVKYCNNVVIDDLNINFPDNGITCILGPSGCGKTTLLNCIAGLIDYSGDIEKKSSKISYVFQNPLLLQHMTVEENIKFVLNAKNLNNEKMQTIVDELLLGVGLYNDRKKYPKELSGGMAQRVSLARAFAYDSNIILMDEPFKGMDISLKKKIIELFLELHNKYKRTTLLVTHDIDEALLLADLVVVMGNKKIIYSQKLYKSESRTVADFPGIRENIYKIL